MFGFQSKERILLDEDIKQIFEIGEQMLRSLRQVFKVYQNKNKRKVEQSELENRSKNIDLLRKNLNLLQEEFKVQASRSKKDFHNRKHGGTDASSLSGITKQTNDDFIDIFKGATKLNESFSSTDEAPLTDDERNILAQFEENDQELEDIAAQICGALDTLKGTAQNIEKTVDE